MRYWTQYWLGSTVEDEIDHVASNVFRRHGVADDALRALEFVTWTQTAPPKFASAGYLDQQTLRGVRDLTPSKTASFDRPLKS